jgi:hypothetical protein
MPAKAGIQNHLKILDSRLRGNDAKGGFKTFYENINVHLLTQAFMALSHFRLQLDSRA